MMRYLLKLVSKVLSGSFIIYWPRRTLLPETSDLMMETMCSVRGVAGLTNERPALVILTNPRAGTNDGDKSNPDPAQSHKMTPQFLFPAFIGKSRKEVK